MWSVVDRNVVMRRIPVLDTLDVILCKLQHTTKAKHLSAHKDAACVNISRPMTSNAFPMFSCEATD